MDLRHMEAFLAVAEELSFTRAAQRLHQVQSGVSATVRALERDLGADLFVRSSRSVELSEAGSAFLPAARDALAAAQAARDAVAGAKGELGGTVRIAIATAIDIVDFPRLLGKFHQAHPGVTLTVVSTTRGNDGVMAALTEGELDLGLLTPTTRPSTVAVHEIARAPVSVVLPVGHPLCERARISLAELAGADFVDLPAGYGGRIINDAAFSAAAVRRRVALEVVDLRSASGYVREGLGVGMFPATRIGEEPGLVARRLDGEAVQWPVAVVTGVKRVPKTAARALRDVLASEAGQLPPGSSRKRVTASKAAGS
jgi:DNA-binding transcriptional LysR family regulator